MSETITRKDAVAKGLPRYFTGIACSKGHVAERYTKNETCCECANATANATKAKDRKKYVQSSVEWARRNPDKAYLYQKISLARRPGHRNLLTANYRTAKDSRMPKWLNQGQMAEMRGIYEFCAAFRKIGLDYHVDHIVPLRGDTVSGLHVPWNLQVIPGEENVRKGNSFNG